MARVMVIVLLLLNAGTGAWLWHDFHRPEPNFSSRERNAEAVRIVSAVPPSEGAARAANREGQAGSLSGAACVALAGLAAEEAPGVREAIGRLGLGDRVRELGGAPPSAPSTFVFQNPDAALLAWLGRLQRGLDAARLEKANCPPGAPLPGPPPVPTDGGAPPPPSTAPVAPPAPPGGRK